MNIIIASNVVKYLDEHQILYDLQHGFCSKRSCETQMTMLTDDLPRNLKNGKQTDIILLVLSKSFDKVNHEKLIFKFNSYGIRGTTFIHVISCWVLPLLTPPPLPDGLNLPLLAFSYLI